MLAGIFSALLLTVPSVSHDLYTAILSTHVREGLVDYRALRKDPRLEKYIHQLALTDPDALPTRNDRLAFWLNAYNALTLKVICDNYPVKSINDLHFGGLLIGQILKKTIWDKEIAAINGKKMSLNRIEHEIIRPGFKEPRIHFALVCAALSCPPLRAEAYEAVKLEAQLNEQGKLFLNSPRHNAFDTREKKARISKIFDWYERDFARTEAELLVYLARFLPEAIASPIKTKPEAWDIDYQDYNWGLNERKAGK